MTPAITDAERKTRKEAVEAALRDGYSPYRRTGGKGSAVKEASRRLGHKAPGKMESFIRSEEALEAQGKPHFLPDWSLFNAPEPEAPIAPPDFEERIRERRLEQENHALKRQVRGLLDQVIELQDVRTQIFDLAESLDAPDVIRPSAGTKRGGKRSAILHVSDVHCGEHIDMYEMDGLNSYDGDICRRRMHRLFQKAASQLTEHWAGDPVEEIVLCFGGDMIDNNLREESRRGGAMPVVESAKLVSELLAAGVMYLREHVGVPIRVYTSPGNHGRLTPKPHLTEGNIDNWDMMVSWSVEKILGAQDWIKFYYTGSGEALFNLYGWWFLLQHGHEGSGGTGGLYGPVYKQVRGMYRAHQSYGRRGRGFHYVLEGHNHTSVKIPFGFANGSVCGYNAFAMRKLKADPSPASQNLLVVEEKHGVIAWHELFLGTPDEGSLYIPPEIEEGRQGKPVMRVQAGRAA